MPFINMQTAGHIQTLYTENIEAISKREAELKQR